jgi:hypothetical protein
MTVMAARCGKETIRWRRRRRVAAKKLFDDGDGDGGALRQKTIR